MTLVPQTRTDPLRAFIAGAFVAGTPRPIPLKATRFDVVIGGGLAIVSTTRTFRNGEPDSIEATITFPVPVHATLFALRARIGERVLDARAKRRETARQDYEQAIERGRTAVLHEEVLRGVHVLSVGHVTPGTEIEVQSTFAVTLTHVGGRGTLRIPLTVGDIYGRSGLADCDELLVGGEPQLAELSVVSRDGPVSLIGGQLSDGRAKVGLDAPIDLALATLTPRNLRGSAADGREVLLRIEPSASGESSLDLALLIDHSGSMAEICAIDAPDTKHQAVLRALDGIEPDLRAADRLDLWEFNDSVRHVGTLDSNGGGLARLARGLNGPSGGTEIGRALQTVISQASADDVLIVTDGKSHALDVHALARAGRSISVVLVGEDSLEANVGHLAALTGGEIFVAAGPDLAAVLRAAVQAMRLRHQAVAPSDAAPTRVSVRRAGMTVSATWQTAAAPIEPTVETRAVAALAAALLLPALPEEEAARLAEAEGLVTHLTSLILVDEEGTVAEGVPATRKVPLPAPRTAMHPVPLGALAMERRYRRAIEPQYCVTMARPADAPDTRPAEHESRRYSVDEPTPERASSTSRNGVLRRLVDLVRPSPAPPRGPTEERRPAPTSRHADLVDLAWQIDWTLAPKRLQAGDLSALPAEVAREIRDVAASCDAIEVAKTLGLAPIMLVIGLLARIAASASRSAARIARAIFGRRPDATIEAAAKQLNLG
jgi:hypothetical protein